MDIIEVKTIQDDFKHFNIDYNYKGRNSMKNPNNKNYIKRLNEISLKGLFQVKDISTIRADYEGMNYRIQYPIYQLLVEDIMDIDLVNFNNIEKYRLILFINSTIINNNSGMNTKFKKMEDYSNYYNNIFKPYFDNKYIIKEVSPIDIKMNMFDTNYEMIFSTGLKMIKNPKGIDIDNNKKYARQVSHKKALKKEYRRLLEGVDIEFLKNTYQLKMIKFIIDNRITQDDAT